MRPWPLLLALLALSACMSARPPLGDDDATDDDDVTEADDDDATEELPDDDDATDPGGDDDDATEAALDPFAARPDTSEGLVNTSAELEEVLEFGALQGACGEYQADPTDRRKKLLCGKWMFFYEGFGTIGIPQPLLDWMARSFPEEVGPAFTEYGLVQDPYVSTAEQPRHLGVGEGAPMGGTPTLALTCANCHFGRMPDGRYSVGYPNLQYEYGTHMLALFMAPSAGMPGFDASAWHPEAVAAIQPILDRFATDPLLGLDLMWNMLPMLVGGASDIPELAVENQGHYASWPPGTMDFVMAPLPLEDDVHTVSRILPLWGIPTAEEEAEFGMATALLAWTGSAQSLDEFLEGFVIVGGGPVEDWGPDAMAPLREYIESLEAPTPLAPGDADAVAAGREQFAAAGCEDCHSGPRGSGVEAFEFDDVGTDATMALWMDPDGDGVACCETDGELTGGIKAPRLAGSHALNRFLHNGSLTSLEQLLCLEPRPPSEQPPFANTGHEFGCDLPDDQRLELLAFLRSI